MATTIKVSGPTRVQVLTSGTTWADLGICDNDTLPSVTITDHIHEVKTSASGMAPEELVLQGITGSITVTLVKWDDAIWTAVQAKQRGAAFDAVVGSVMVGGQTAKVFGVRLNPVETGKDMYTFPLCYLMNDTTDSQFGNVERRLAVTFRAIPDPSTGVLCTYATNTPPP